jgi:hypothetical protein
MPSGSQALEAVHGVPEATIGEALPEVAARAPGDLLQGHEVCLAIEDGIDLAVEDSSPGIEVPGDQLHVARGG